MYSKTINQMVKLKPEQSSKVFCDMQEIKSKSDKIS